MDYTVTLALTDEQRAMIDEARGELDLATFVKSSTLAVAEELLTDEPRTIEDLTPGLSVADHIRLADAAAAGPTMSLEEVKAGLDQLMAELRAKAARANR